MSVSLTYTLPNAPTGASQVEYVPLGGNGYQAPLSYYAFDLELVSDVSGGASTIQINMDARYTTLVGYLSALVTGVAADTPVELLLAASPIDRIGYTDNVPFRGISTYEYCTIAPQPFLMRAKPGDYPWARLKAANVNGETWKLVGRVYNFNVNAEQYVPLGEMVSILPR